jgi:hypothetical protein
VNRRILAVVAVLAFSLGLRVWLTTAPVTPSRLPLAEFPRHLGKWEAVSDGTIDSDTLAILKPDDYLLRIYRGAGGKVC